MKYLIEMTQKQIQKIEGLMAEDKYRSVAQFINTAITNQIFLEHSDSETIENIPHNKVGPVAEKELFYSIPKIPTVFEKYDLKNLNNSPEAVEIPELKNIVSSVPRKSRDEVGEKYIWMWGQINRIFPVKIGLRVLFVLLGERQWMDLEEFSDTAANIASEIGEIISIFEKSKTRLYGSKLSAGLPSKKSYKSKMRYKSHFLTIMMNNGLLDGAMCVLRFANLKKTSRGSVEVGITKPGIEFARIENPIIDGEINKISFNKVEIEYYLNHIKKYVPGENYAFLWLLQKLSNNPAGPEDINEELNREIGNKWGISTDFVNTQRAGLMARMYELGLIEKKKTGLNVTYSISNSGKIKLRDMIKQQ